MQNGKIPGPDAFTVDLFKSFYDMLKYDLLLMAREINEKVGFMGL